VHFFEFKQFEIINLRRATVGADDADSGKGRGFVKVQDAPRVCG
jgi:hypothetical protein